MRPRAADRLEQQRELGVDRLEPPRDRLLERVREVELAGLRLVLALGRETARELDGVQGVAAGDLVDPAQHRPRDRRDGPGQNAADGRRPERTEVGALDATRWQRRQQAQRVIRLDAGPGGGDDTDRRRVQPPQREAKRARGGEVEPLRVVDRDDHGPGLRLEPQCVQHGAPAGERVVVPEQRLRVEVDVLEQVDQPAERERHLLLRRSRHEHMNARGPAAAERGPPQRRLADSRLASDDERPGALG